MKALTAIFTVLIISSVSAVADLSTKPVDYLKLSYEGMKCGQVYLRIHNTSDKTVSYLSDSGNKTPIHYTDVYRSSFWRRDKGLRCATGQSLAELAPGESYRFRVLSGVLTPIVGDKIKLRLRSRATPRATWQAATTEPDTFVSESIAVTKKELKEVEEAAAE